jgi:hypothetical protein
MIEEDKETSDAEDRCGSKKVHTDEKDPFFDECVKHDRDYVNLTDPDDLFRADLRFFKGIWKKALKNWLLIPRALIYTVIVQGAGRFYWRRSDGGNSLKE